jgi:hypothetical protein
MITRYANGRVRFTYTRNSCAEAKNFLLRGICAYFCGIYVGYIYGDILKYIRAIRQIGGFGVLFGSVWSLCVVCCVVSLSPPRQFLLKIHIQEANPSQKSYESSIRHFVTEGSALTIAVVSFQRAAVSTAFCCSVSLRAPFIQLQRALQLVN